MSVPKYWREIPQRYRLQASVCVKCKSIFFPPRLICRKCRSQEFEKVNLPENGKIYAFTIVRVSTSQFSDQTPYAIGIIELENGVRITTQIVDCDFSAIKTGGGVKLEFRKIQEEGKAGIICYGYKAVLTE